MKLISSDLSWQRTWKAPEGVRVALEGGVDTIEHGAEPDEHIIELFRERNAALVTTLSPALPFALFDREVSHATELSQYNGDIVFRGIIDCAKACLDVGITVGLGTDTACPSSRNTTCGASSPTSCATAT